MQNPDPWTGQVLLSTTRALYVGPASDTSVHAHRAIQACFALDGSFALRREPNGPWATYEAAIIGSDVRHQLDGHGRLLLLLFVEPESSDGRRVSVFGPRGEISTVDELILDDVRDSIGRSDLVSLSDSAARDLFESVFRSLDMAPVRVAELDARIGRIVRDVRADPNRYGSIPKLANSVGLSPSRFRHLFTAEMGISCQRFLLWLRLYDGIRQLAHGISLTETAHSVGFADAAYFARTFKRMFGIAPSAIKHSVRLIQEDQRTSGEIAVGSPTRRDE